MSAIILNTFLSLGLLPRLKYAIIKFCEIDDRASATVRADRINRRIKKERNRDRSVSGRGLINERGVTWRCAAHQPRFAPFHLRFHPLLRRSFGFAVFFAPLLFLSRSSASSYLCYTYFVNETVLSLLFRFFFSLSFSLYTRAVPPRDQLIFLFQPSLLSRIFALPRFSAITFRNTVSLPRTFSPYDFAVANDSLEYLLDESFIHVFGLLDKRVGRSGGLLSRPTPRDPRSLLHLRYGGGDGGIRSENCFLRLTTAAFSTFNPHPLFSHQSNL